MARAPAQNRVASFFGGGGRLPPVIGVLMAATFVASILGVVGARHGFPLLAQAALIAERVRHLELWRTFTWIFFVGDPWSLLFACLAMSWVGRDFAQRWGTGRFILAYLGLGVAIAGVVLLISLVYPPSADFPYLGCWPVLDALIIMWASLYRSRQIRFFFVTLTGTQMMWTVVGLTVLQSVFYSLEPFIPNFVADILALAWVYGPSPREAWIEHKLRGMEQKRKGSHLRSVPRDTPRDAKDGDGEQPPGGRWLN